MSAHRRCCICGQSPFGEVYRNSSGKVLIVRCLMLLRRGKKTGARFYSNCFQRNMSGEHPKKRRLQKGRRKPQEAGPRIQVTDAPQQRKRLKIDKEAKKLIVILENCPLETAQVGNLLLVRFSCFFIFKIGKEYDILRSDKHISFIKKHNKDPADFRPDILHQVCPASTFIL